MARIYVSGKIGDLNMSEVAIKFAIGVAHLETLGHSPVNPLGCHDKDDVPCPNPTEWKHYMLNDIAELFDCDGILMLHDWQESPGAKVEHAIAQAMGKQILYMATHTVQPNELTVPKSATSLNS